MASVVQKYMHALKAFGWKETLIKMYTVGEVKFGSLIGVDRNGNKYFENLEYPFGQHRWVEYKDIHNFEPTSVPPEWHGWLHHQTDDTPKPLEKTGLPITKGEHTPYKLSVGKTDYKGEEQHNWTSHRQRGYKVGSLHQGPDEPDKYWTQPGHPLNPGTNKGGRFKSQKGMEVWDPNDEKGDKTKKPIRSLDEL